MKPTRMWTVRDLFEREGWRGVLREYYREVKILHVSLLEARLTREAAAASAHAPLTRKRPAVQARLVATSDAGEDVPLASLTDDLRRKKALRPVMGPQESDNYQRDDGSWTGGDPALAGQLHKEDVNFRHDSTEQQQCQDCKSFRAPSGCARVSGLIQKTTTCDLFAPSRAQEALRVFKRNMKKYPA